MKKVMVVDDDKEFLVEISEVLKCAGYHVMAFGSGDEALEVVSRDRPDVIVLDLKLEGGSGFKVADELRLHSETANIPLIAMTGVYTQKEHWFPMRACGFAQCLIKPVNPLDLIAAVENIFKRRQWG